MEQDEKIKKLDGELGRKTFLDDKRIIHLKRLAKMNDQMREAAQNLIGIINQKYQNIVDDIEANEALGNMTKIVQNYGVGVATSVEDE